MASVAPHPRGCQSGLPLLARLVGNHKATKKHVPVDARGLFFEEIEDWRGDLAEDIISHNELKPRKRSTPRSRG